MLQHRGHDHPDDLDQTAIDNLLRVARAHRQHERFHAMEGLEGAAALRRDANALRALADCWLEATTYIERLERFGVSSAAQPSDERGSAAEPKPRTKAAPKVAGRDGSRLP